MTPHRLQLRNFMSYGEGVEPLNFDGLRLVCLSGDNGNGKTALLDAMTWALFGETRAKSDDDVIRLGRAECEVIFDFKVGTEKYRIIRKKSKKASQWEFQIWQPDDSLRTLTGVNARETKAKIEKLLHMDYKTFLSTSYLAQGRADEFTRANASGRKEVLANILDLSRYDRLEELAKERQKEAGDRQTDAERTISLIDRELENEDYHAVELDKAQARQTEMTAEIAVLDTELSKLRDRLTVLEQADKRQQELTSRRNEIADEIARSERDRETLRKNVSNAEKITAQRAQIEADFADLGVANERYRRLRDEQQQLLRQQSEARRLQEAIRAEEQKWEKERYRAQTDLQNLDRDNDEREQLQVDLIKTDAEIAGFADLETETAQAKHVLDAAKEKYDQQVTELNVAKAQVKRLQVRLDALQSSDAALCEYCGQPLNQNGRQQAIRESERELSDVQRQIADIKKSGSAASQHLKDCDDALQNLQKRERELSAHKARREQMILRAERLARQAAQKPELQTRYDDFDKRLKTQDFAHPEQQSLKVLLAAMGDENQLNTALKETETIRERLHDAPVRLDRLQTALQSMQSEPPKLRDCELRITDLEVRRGETEELIHQLSPQIADLAVLRAGYREKENRRRHWDDEIRTVERAIGEHRGALDRMALRRIERTKWEQERGSAVFDGAMHKELAAAFGKKGVQALIIERALPAIQTMTNHLLDRLTTNGTQVEFVTQKDAKTKTATGTIETLEIIARDNDGQRAYEMYSGGEAFRINFALRVALSQELARRAGAPLQTLIIDEGFGTQDGRGREAIADTLREITNDFALVLVITHMDDLKNEFPSRIEVVKGRDGSSFVVDSAV